MYDLLLHTPLHTHTSTHTHLYTHTPLHTHTSTHTHHYTHTSLDARPPASHTSLHTHIPKCTTSFFCAVGPDPNVTTTLSCPSTTINIECPSSPCMYVRIHTYSTHVNTYIPNTSIPIYIYRYICIYYKYIFPKVRTTHYMFTHPKVTTITLSCALTMGWLQWVGSLKV